MMRFLQTHRLALTPLTPIHIGCGEDFEPTNYVIDDDALFHFDPAAVPLDSKDRDKLKQAVDARGDEAIRNVQRFFFERRERYAAASRQVVAVAPGVAEQYAKRVGQVAQHEAGGKRVANRLDIERTAYHPYSGAAYVPGSSLKGAVRTAWLNGINRGRGREGGETSTALEKRLLEGAFETDPFRLVRWSDAAGADLLTKVVFSTNQKKRAVFKNNLELSGQGPVARRQVISGGQYRALAGEIRFDNLGGIVEERKTPRLDKRIGDFAALARACNRFYLDRLAAELEVIKARGFASEEWVNALHEILTALDPVLKEEKAMLLRVGRHSGAESVTLDGARSIRIMKGPKQPPEHASESTTLWLAADYEDDRSDLLPFGWLLVEMADSPENPALRAWCDAQPKPNLAAVQARLREAKARAKAASAEQRRLAEAREAAQARAAREAALREERLATLSDQGKQIEALWEKLAKHTGRKQPVGGSLYGELQKLLKPALEGGWSDDDKRALADLIAGTASEKIDFGGKASDIKRALRQLRGES